jgi:hypothetical protein
MDAGEVDLKERIWMRRMKYSILKEHECGWSNAFSVFSTCWFFPMSGFLSLGPPPVTYFNPPRGFTVDMVLQLEERIV